MRAFHAAQGVDDGVVAVVDAIAEKVLPEELPDVLHRVEFRRIGRQVQQADVVREVPLPAEPMPPDAIQQQDGMRASRDMAADLNQMQVHRLGIGLRQDEGCAGAARRTDRAEDVGPVIALIARRRRPGALFRPDVGQAALLADACFILPPELDRLAAGRGRDGVSDQCGKVLWDGPPLYPAA